MKPRDLFEPRDYFVSARDAGRTALLAGPFATHGEALARVDAANAAACQLDPRAHWWAFGTCSLAAPSGYVGKLNGRLGIILGECAISC